MNNFIWLICVFCWVCNLLSVWMVKLVFVIVVVGLVLVGLEYFGFWFDWVMLDWLWGMYLLW